jgi:hypothetical protein
VEEPVYGYGSEAVKPAAPGVALHVSIAIELAQEDRANREAFERRMRYLNRSQCLKWE